ncbi:MAG: carboxypeptidase-like regulatory domain-containing protein, partial [Alistipes sp.]|nr:carboxypeptidase-like regulatory domain-containing protein [Alistipes sp.]
MNLRIFGAIIMLLMPTVVSAENAPQTKNKRTTDANIYGHVISASTGEHLPYVNIGVKGTTIGCASDATGHYFLKNLPAGENTIVVASLGYKTIEQTIEAVPDKNIEINFTLEEDSMMVDEVVVSATRN